VHFTGTIVPSVNGLAQISLPLPGVISRIFCKPGQIVDKGALLIEVTGNELIDLQRAYVESAAILIRLKSEYERVKALSGENIGSKKEYILAESACLTEQAKFNALKIKLKNIGLDVERIQGEAFYPSYSVKSPIRGCVTNIHVNIGQYAESERSIAEVIDVQSFQLKLSVFEKDISKVTENQIVEFYLPANRNEKYRSKLISAGKTIQPDSKSVDCYADIESGTDHKFVSYQFVEGDVFVANDTVVAVPETAILSSANKSFVLILEREAGDSYYFRKTEVVTGRTGNDLVELTGPPPTGKLLVKGIYNIQAE
jgi:cobalt-zinc-cadmium efflux system membrane fusion protein